MEINRYIPEKAYLKIQECEYKNKDHLYIILDMINRITIFHKRETDYGNEFIDIPKNYFRDIIVDSTSLKETFNFLKQNRIIECDDIYSQIGGKALGYRISNEYFSKLTQVKVSKPTLTKKIISNVNKEKNRVNEKYHKYRNFFLGNFGIEYTKAINHLNIQLNTCLCGRNSLKERIKAINKYNHQYMAISAINDGELFFRHNKTNGRIDTNLTNLKSELKQFISIPGLVQLDISNSQPYILSLHPNLYLCGRISIENDIKKYKLWTEKGVFYENFQREYFNQKGIVIPRKEIKDIMFGIYYSRNEYQNKYGVTLKPYLKEKKIFQSIFPSVYSFIESQKKNKKHNQLAIELQKLESEICIDTICQELDKQNINYFTIHDAWLVDRFDEIKVKEIIENEFIKKYNSKPTIKTEKITN